MTAALTAIAAFTLAASVAAMTRRNLLHSVLILALAWAGVAFFYLWAGAQFLAFAQVLIYLGAISMAALFAVLLTRRSRDDVAGPAAGKRAVLACACAVALAAVLLVSFARSPLEVMASKPAVLTVRQLGLELMGAGVPALLAVGVLLTVALIGAVVIASGEPEGGKEDTP